MLSNTKLLKRISYHLIFWIFFTFLYPLFFTIFLYNSFTVESFRFQILALLYSYFYMIPAIYFITYYFIPKLLHKKQITLFVILLFCIVIILAFIDDLFNIYVFMPKYSPHIIERFKEIRAFKPIHLFVVSILLFTQIILFISIKFLKEYIINFFEKQKLKEEIYNAEIKMLRSQLHPHFLFNTLNNIYSLSTDCANPLISQSIERISTILRYSLYECNKEVVNLLNEIKIIKDYIELERIRYSNIAINTSFPRDTNNIFIIPMLLFTFVENAFKHGTSNAIKNKWIKLDLSIANNKLHFKVSNSKNPNTHKNLNHYTEGIGLKNAIKRLELYYGSDNFTLSTTESKDSFEIKLTIKIKS